MTVEIVLGDIMKSIDKENKICAYCELSQPTYKDDEMLCNKHGVVYAFYRCPRFVYDPMKRRPAPKLQIPDIFIDEAEKGQ